MNDRENISIQFIGVLMWMFSIRERGEELVFNFRCGRFQSEFGEKRKELLERKKRDVANRRERRENVMCINHLGVLEEHNNPDTMTPVDLSLSPE